MSATKEWLMDTYGEDYFVDPEDFVKTLTKVASQITLEIKSQIYEEAERIGKETVQEVKALSPKYKGKSKKLIKGKYRRGWTYHIDRSRGNIKITVYNKEYQLVHLLELGHCLKDGTGRVYGKVPAYPHVEIAEKHAEEKINKLLEDL